MTQSWYEAMVRASWQGALLVAFVWLVLGLWKRSTPAARTWLWMIATAKFLLVLLIIVEVPVLAPVAAGSSGVGSAQSLITYNYGALQAAPIDWTPVLFWAWLFGVGAMVARAFHDHARLRLLARGSVPADERVVRIWDEVSLGAAAVVRTHPDATVPLVFGLLHPRVLLPQRLVAQLCDDELRMVLAHEAAHVRRRDTVASLYMFVCFVLFYFHPAVWLARREWQIDREAACDRSAIESTRAEAHGYAAMLLKVSAGADRAPVLALSAVPTYRTLQRRINEMKKPKNNLRSGRAVWALLALLVSAGAVPVVLTQRQPHFGAGVFETKWPEVKVTQALKGKQAPREEAVAVAMTTDSAIAMSATAPTAAGGEQTAVATGPVGHVLAPQAAQAGPPALAPGGGVATSASPAGAPTGLATTVGPSGAAATVAPSGLAKTVGPSVGVGRAALAGQVSTPLPTTSSPVGGGTEVAALTTGLPQSTAVRDAAVTANVSVGQPSLVTIVLRDKKTVGGTGLDTPVSIELDDVAVVDFFKFLSSVTKVKIKVVGVRSGMHLNAQIENTTLGEVMGTLAKVYGLEWKLQGDGSITVQPFRK